jgi:hypothetical protein
MINDITNKLDETNPNYVKKIVDNDTFQDIKDFGIAAAKFVETTTFVAAIVTTSIYAMIGFANRYSYSAARHPDNIQHEEYMKEMEGRLESKLKNYGQLTNKSSDEIYLIYKYQNGDYNDK